MQRVKAEDLREDVIPILRAEISEEQLYQIFPIEFDELDPLCEPEPSVGALLRLESGDLVVVTYGRETGTLVLQIPESESVASTSTALFKEIPMLKEKTTWRASSEVQNPESCSPRIAAK